MKNLFQNYSFLGAGLLIFNFVFIGLPEQSAANDQVRLGTPQPPGDLIGIASRDITPTIGVPLAGFGGGKRRLWPFDVFGLHPYAAWLKPSEGIRDPIRAKVTFLQSGDQKLVFVSLDLIGTLPELVDPVVELTKDLGVTRNNLIISATHTHSGPGAITKNVLWSLLAVDRYQRSVADRLINDVARAIRDAYDQRLPAQLFHSSFVAEGFQKNRREKVGYYDSRAHLLLARSLDGFWRGGMVAYAIHGTSLGTNNLHFSADVAGEIERAIESRLKILNGPHSPTVHMGFFNGAEGDVSPTGDMVAIGNGFADKAMLAMADLRELRLNFEVKRKKVKLGWPHLNLHGCTEKFLPKVMKGNLWPIFGTESEVWAIRLDDVYMMSFPGEMNTSLGFAAHAAAQAAGWDTTIVLGLVNDHRSYFTNPQEYYSGEYEACGTFYGKNGGTKLVDAHRSLLLQMHP